MQSKDMPGAGCASRAAAPTSSRQAWRTVESIEGEDGGVTDGPCKNGGCRIVRRRPPGGSHGDAYAAAAAGSAVTADRAVLAVPVAVGGVCGGGGGCGG